MSGDPTLRRDWLSWTLLASLGVIWGASFTTTGVAIRDLPPATVAAARIAIGAAALLPLAFWLGGGLPGLRTEDDRRFWRQAAICAVASNAAPFILLSWAQNHVSSGLAGVFMATLPLIVLPLAYLFVPSDRLTWAKAAGFGIGFCGVIVLIGPSVLTELGGGGALSLLAQIACLGAATGYAIGSIASKLAPPTHPIAFGAATLAIAAPLSAAPALIVERPFEADWTTDAALAVLYLGLTPTGLAMVLLFIVVQRRGPSFLSLVNYQVPVWALIFGVAFLGETVPTRAPLALALILAGVAISQNALGPLWRRLAPTRT